MALGYRDAPESRSAGWYPDEHDPALERWWNGIGWSDTRRPRAGGPLLTASGPTAAAIPQAAAPRSTVQSLSGDAAPRARPAAGSGSGAGESAGAIPGLAVVAGLVGLVLSATGFTIVSTVAAILGVAGLARAGRRGGAGRGAAGAGLILGLLGWVLTWVVASNGFLRDWIAQLVDLLGS
jgi:hypothetical protein